MNALILAGLLSLTEPPSVSETEPCPAETRAQAEQAAPAAPALAPQRQASRDAPAARPLTRRGIFARIPDGELIARRGAL
jgi:hypothetical protein